MNTELDYDLTPDQWEALKALRATSLKTRALNRFVLEDLIALRLAAISDDLPVITPWGRKVLVRGSTRLWDVAA
jgi:hypothetical protein